ncbi:MAG: DUF4386 domain-containing protein [Ignavibacteriales bacterium]|nr:DUF4386 domain-containing protein [Ignavibacteriales bacterium]
MTQLQKNARIAGLFYLLMAITGPFVLIYVPTKLFVTGDAAATASNIFSNQSLFRAYIVVGIFAEMFFILTVLALYRLLKDVNCQLAKLMVILVLVDAPLAFIGSANQIATLSFVQGSDLLSVFDKPQRDALATLLINIDKQGVPVSELFWGLWLIPLALLVYRSGFLPRFLGVWLFLNGIAYVTISFFGILLPELVQIANKIGFPLLLGEVAFLLWLLIVGAKQKPPSQTVTDLG